MKTKIVIHILVTTILLCTEIHTVYSQDSWRVNKIKSDSVELNKYVQILIDYDKETVEGKFAIENIKNKYNWFLPYIPLKYLTTQSTALKSAIEITNFRYKSEIIIQRMYDELMPSFVKIKDIYVSQGFESSQADYLVLQKSIVPVCFKSQSDKERLSCTVTLYQQYLEYLGILNSEEINSLANQLEIILRKELKLPTTIKKPIKKK
jgi:hypothetical protein